MNIYFDLSFLLQIILGYTSLYFAKTLLIKKTKLYLDVIFSLIIGFSVYLVYIHLFYSILIYLIYVSIFLILIFKKNFIKSVFLYFLCYSLLTYIIDKLSIYNACYNFILVINSPKGILSYIFGPLFLIGLILSTKIVDSLYRLSNYKMSCYLLKEEKKYYYTCYFDTGNTLKYNDVPVIFINKDKYPFKLDNVEVIDINGINSTNKSYVQSCLLSLEDKKDLFFVYVVLVEKEDFNGCEILLNAYLR